MQWLKKHSEDRTTMAKASFLLPTSSAMLKLGGVILIGLGLYFVVLRPPLLPEDSRFMGRSMEQIQVSFPGLLNWLSHVFGVMGGYMMSTGLLTCYVAHTSFRNRVPGAAGVAVVTGLTSIGIMVMVNFLINSDFKWVLFSFTLPWVASLWLYGREEADGK
jgi:hypothetical protein